MLKLEVNWLKTDALIVCKRLKSVLTYGQKMDLEYVSAYVIKYGILSDREGIAVKNNMLL